MIVINLGLRAIHAVLTLTHWCQLRVINKGLDRHVMVLIVVL